jgi:hypothetical protein
MLIYVVTILDIAFKIYSNVPQNEDAELVTSEKSKFSVA